MEISIEMPLDTDGFMRRQCPACDRQFKWFHGRTDTHPDDWDDPDSYYCPYCGGSAATNAWFTDDQVAYAEQMAFRFASDTIDESLTDMARRSNSQHVKFDYRSGSPPATPAPLHEPPDMTAVASPCHTFEPVKVAENWQEPLHCLICGALFEA